MALRIVRPWQGDGLSIILSEPLGAFKHWREQGLDARRSSARSPSRASSRLQRAGLNTGGKRENCKGKAHRRFPCHAGGAAAAQRRLARIWSKRGWGCIRTAGRGPCRGARKPWLKANICTSAVQSIVKTGIVQEGGVPTRALVASVPVNLHRSRSSFRCDVPAMRLRTNSTSAMGHSSRQLGAAARCDFRRRINDLDYRDRGNPIDCIFIIILALPPHAHPD